MSADTLREYRSLLEQARNKRPTGKVGVSVTRETPRSEQTSTQIREFIERTGVRTQRLDNLVMADNTVGKVFSGALLWSGPIEDGQLQELPRIKHRPTITCTVSGPILETSSFEHDGDFSSFQKACSAIVKGIRSTPVRLKSDFRVSSSLEDALLDIGMSAKYWVVKVDAGFRRTTSRQRSYAVLALDQVYYSVSTDAAPEGGYLPDGIVSRNTGLARILCDGIQENGEVVYVRKVDYGRRLIIVLSAEASLEDMRGAIKVTVDSVAASGEASFSDSVKKTWSGVEGQLILIGGRYPSDIGSAFSGSPDSFVKAVKSVMAKENVIYSEDEGAVPVSFELAYVSDGAPLQVFETADFAGTIPGRSWGMQELNQPISTSGLDARVVRQDAEIHSDDWTLIDLASQELRLSEDRKTVFFDLVWKACEGDANKTIKRTIIESRKTFEFAFPRPIREIVSPTKFGSHGEWVAGQNHGHVSLPNFGLLSNVRVRFDAPGSHDDRAQSLNATLRFGLWMED